MRTNYELQPGQKFVGPAKVVLIEPKKVCKCCQKEWPRVPAFALETTVEQGYPNAYWWDCNCKSTMFWKSK